MSTSVKSILDICLRHLSLPEFELFVAPIPKVDVSNEDDMLTLLFTHLLLFARSVRDHSTHSEHHN